MQIIFKILTTLFLLFMNFLPAQFRDQFVKWKIGASYSKGFVDKLSFNQYNATLAVAVAIDENDVYDSASLYYEPYGTYSFLEQSPFSNISFQVFSSGVNLKKHINDHNYKKTFYVYVGPEISIIRFRQSFANKNYNYIMLKSDYLINIGIGAFISSNIELFAQYKVGLTKIYPITSLNDNYRLQAITLGFKIAFNENWWFRGK